MIAFIDEKLKEWANVQYLTRDRAQGWSGQSPICRLGGVSGKVWGGDIQALWRPTETDVADVDAAVEKLRDDERIVVASYYLKCGCNKSAAARMVQVPRQTFVDRLSAVHQRINSILN